MLCLIFLGHGMGLSFHEEMDVFYQILFNLGEPIGNRRFRLICRFDRLHGHADRAFGDIGVKLDHLLLALFLPAWQLFENPRQFDLQFFNLLFDLQPRGFGQRIKFFGLEHFLFGNWCQGKTVWGAQQRDIFCLSFFAQRL